MKLTDEDRYQMAVTGNEHVLRGMEVACTAGMNVMLQSSDHRGYAEDLVWACQQIAAECAFNGADQIEIKHFGYCPCGYLKSPSAECHCTFEQVARYQIRARHAMPKYPMWLQGAQAFVNEVFDRHRDLEVPGPIAKRVAAAIKLNHDDVVRVGELNKDCHNLMRCGFEQLDLGIRGVAVALELTNAIARLDVGYGASGEIQIHHIAEALQYIRRPWLNHSQVRS